MTYNLQNKINSDINLKRFLRENSYWYKILNRNEYAFNDFVNEMKVKYKLTTSDKINRTIDGIGMLQSFLEVLKQIVYNFFKRRKGMNEIMEKTFELIDVLEESSIIKDITYYKDRILRNDDLRGLIDKGNSSDDKYLVMDVKRRLYKNKDYEGYMKAYNELMYIVMSINNRYKKLLGKGSCFR